MKIVASTTFVTLLLALPSAVLALGMETIGNAAAVKQPEWAEGVVDVVNLKTRVYSQWVNGNERFFYRGNAQALNEALRKYAAVKDDVRQLIVLPGAGKTQTFNGKPIGFDWELDVPSGIYRAVSKRKHAVMTVHLSGKRPRPLERKQVEKWLGDLNSDSFKIREKATQELQKLGNDAKPYLRAALKARPDPETRLRIEALLKRLRELDMTDLEIPKGITVINVDDLVAARLKDLKDPDATVCGLAVQELSTLAPYSDKVVPALVEMLKKDKHEYVRRVTAGCLAHLGVKAKSAVPFLKQGLDDRNTNIRDAFQSALDRIKAASDEGAKRLMKAMDGFRHKLPPAQGLNEMNGPGVPDVDGKVNPDSHLHGIATRLGAKTRAECMVLMTHLNDRDPKIRRIAAFALESILKAYPNGFPSGSLDKLASAEHRTMVKAFAAGIEKLAK